MLCSHCTAQFHNVTAAEMFVSLYTGINAITRICFLFQLDWLFGGREGTLAICSIGEVSHKLLFRFFFYINCV